MKNFVVKYTIDFKPVEMELGIRKAQIMKKGGIENFVVSFERLDKWKSGKQNRTFHCLLSLFYRSGCYSQNADSVDELKRYYKHNIGLIKGYVYYNGTKLVEVKERNEIPNHISSQACRIILDSWSKASKKQAREGIDLLKTDMLNSGVESTSYGKEFHAILNELEAR